MKGGGDGDGDGDGDSDGDSEFRDPSECQVNLLVMLISDNKINGDSRDIILSTESVISGKLVIVFLFSRNLFILFFSADVSGWMKKSI